MDAFDDLLALLDLRRLQHDNLCKAMQEETNATELEKLKTKTQFAFARLVKVECLISREISGYFLSSLKLQNES